MSAAVPDSTRSHHLNNASTSPDKASKKKTLIKVLILGSAGVGKTSLLNRFVDENYSSNYKSTIGSDLRSKDIVINDEVVTLQLVDTAGQERFNSLSTQFYRGAQMCLLVFDITDSKSFESLSQWRDEFLAATSTSTGSHIDEADFPFACIGNKLDLQQNRSVSQRRAIAWCNYISSTNLYPQKDNSTNNLSAATGSALNNDSNLPYYEVSAKDSTNVTLCFMELARKAWKNSKSQQKNAEELYRSNIVVPTAAAMRKQRVGNTDSSCC
jgi:Ras-related protein Rab-7A